MLNRAIRLRGRGLRGRGLLIGLVVLCLSCGGSGKRESQPDDADQSIGRQVSFDPPPPQDIENAGLPQLANGRLLALAIPGGQLELDPTRRDPVTALGACTHWISSCVEPESRSLDDCARSAPACLTDRPWEEDAVCCPTACFDAYERARQSGTEPMTAFPEVYFRGATCFPGVAEMVGG